jgi:hypothetical protein
MARKQNCWAFMKCGREPSGIMVPDLGVCLAATDILADGLNSGKNGGRICWAIAGSYANLDNMVCTYAAERFSCINCPFFALVEKEECFENFHILKPGQEFLF